MTKPRIALVISSTRPTRFADKPAAWLLDQMKARTDLDVEVVDLRDYPMPFFSEVASNAWAPTQDPTAQAWQKKVGSYDGYVFLVAEYNRSITGALKNALDQAYVEWQRKPMAIFAYGSVGGARAAEHLRTIAIELQMVPVRHGVHIGGSDFFKVTGYGPNLPMSEIAPVLTPSTKAMLDDVVWWAHATMAAKAADRAKAA